MQLLCRLSGVGDTVSATNNAAQPTTIASAISRPLFLAGRHDRVYAGSRNDLFYWPLDLDAGRMANAIAARYPEANVNRPLRVVHAANHRFFKGTRYLLDAIERLRGEGVEIELVLVEKKSNDDALELYRTADVVFDQCVSGFSWLFHA